MFPPAAKSTALALVLLLSTGIAVAQQRSTQGERLQLCTQHYDPVCAVKGGASRTHSNACMARAAGARVVARGRCKHELRRGPR